jgi:hypothetical protein
VLQLQQVVEVVVVVRPLQVQQGLQAVEVEAHRLQVVEVEAHRLQGVVVEVEVGVQRL